MYYFIGLCLFLLVSYAVLIEYYRRSWNRIPVAVMDGFAVAEKPALPVSVIIPARNEEANIVRCIEAILQQDYPARLLEIIVVNDHSTDRTANLVKAYFAAGVKLIDLQWENNLSTAPAYKKKAIEQGILESRGQLILCTDADCSCNPHWVSSMVAAYLRRQAVFLAAPVKINHQPSFLSTFEVLDFLALQGITGASVFSRLYSMCNGANLAYSKEAFFAVKGFEGIDSIPSGDDMLLMHKMAKAFPGQLYYVKSRDAMVSTQTAPNWNAFIQQRIRWASKSDQYDDRNIFYSLLLVWMLNFSLLLLLIGGILDLRLLLAGLIIICIKAALEYPFMLTVARFFDQSMLLKYFLLMQPFHIVYTVLAGVMGRLRGYEWKGRKIK
jgi:cellulose synthase/poly-beta-1,6-N-acetylglucosamine synthase-like glycosyltransferase